MMACVSGVPGSYQARRQNFVDEADCLLCHETSDSDYGTHGQPINLNAEITPVDPNGTVVYKRRWYIMLLFSLIALNQTSVWNTWNPLTQSVQLAFNWTISDVALLANWGCITYVLSMPFFSWMMDVKGWLSLKN